MLSGLPASGDGAKLQLVGATWGTPHHSGYPLWTMLANALHRVMPFGTPAYHVDLLSALCSIVGSLFFFASTQILGLRRSAAFALTLAFGGTATLWSQSVRAEVYTLHYAFMAGVLFFLLRWAADRRELDLCFAVALFALSFSNHLTAICLAPAFVAFVFVTDRRRFFSPRVLAAGLVGTGATLLCYGYIVLRTVDPSTSYLESQGTSLWEVLSHLASNPKRGHYFTKDPSLLLTERLPFVVSTLDRELRALLPISLLGALKAPKQVNLLLGLAALGNLAFVTSFTVPDSFVYFIPLYLILALWAALGLEAIARQVLNQRRWSLVLGLVLLAGLFLGPRISQALASTAHLKTLDHDLRATLERLPASGALLLSTDYETSMGLLARAAQGRSANGRIHVLHTPPATLPLRVALEPLQRYLRQDLPLRQRERSGWIEGGLPTFCLCRQPEHAEALSRLGFEAIPLGERLYRLETASSGPDAGGSEKVPATLPRLVVVGDLEGAEDLGEALAIMKQPSFDPTRTAILLGSSSQGDPASKLVATFLEEGHGKDRIEVVVELPAPGWLVWTETVSARWQAQVDGEERHLLEVNALFPALALEAGRHHVSFFRTRSF